MFLTSESLRRGVPGTELVADPHPEPGMLSQTRRPDLSYLGCRPASEDHDRFMAEDGRACWGGLGGSVLTRSVLMMGVLAETMAAAASGSCRQARKKRQTIST